MNVTFNESVPPGGTYANGALVWNTPHEFTIDFTSHRSPIQDGDAQDVLVVARMKTPHQRHVPDRPGHVGQHRPLRAAARPHHAQTTEGDTMSDNNGQAFANAGRFDFIVRADDDHVSISRPVSGEDVDRVRRQLAEWATRHSAQSA